MKFNLIPQQELPTSEQVVDLEKKIGHPLPPDYRRFLLTYNGADYEMIGPPDDDSALGFPVPRPLQDSLENDFFIVGEFNSIKRDPEPYGLWETYKDTLDWKHPAELLPFAHDPGGVHFFICLAGLSTGAVYMGGREYSTKYEQNLPISVKNYCQLAASFTEFLELLVWKK